MTRRVVGALLVLVLACGATACSKPQKRGAGPRRVVVSSVAPITDIVRQVVGTTADVVGLVPDGVDGHTFQSTPLSSIVLLRANVLFVAGMSFETKLLDEAREAMQNGSTIVRLGELTVEPSGYAYGRSYPAEAGRPNPHVWMDPVHAKRFAEIVAYAMAKVDPGRASAYENNARRFAAVLDKLHTAIGAALRSVPADARELVTTHDAFPYFARRYGLTVLAAMQRPDLSPPDQAQETDLVSALRAAGVRAVFVSDLHPSPHAERIARRAGASIAGTLRDETLPGAEGDANHTYVGMMLEDARVIAEGLGGDASPLRALAASPSPGRS